MTKVLIAFLVCLHFIFGTLPFSVQASMFGFVTKGLSEDEKAAVLDKVNLNVVTDDSYQPGIQCFDVSRNGTYALAVGKGSNCRIYLYAQNGKFLYGYALTAEGDYGIEFIEDNLAIYFLRGNTIMVCDSTGNCLDIQQVTDSPSNFSHAKKILNRTEKNLNGKTYCLERDAEIGDAYSRFVVVDERGIKTVLMDTSVDHHVSQLALIVVPVCFFLLVLRVIYGKRE